MKEVDIVMAGRSWVKCPFDKETWTCNNGYDLIGKNVTKISKNFVMHKQVYTSNQFGHVPIFNFEHMQSASDKCGFKIVSWHDIPELKSPEKFPFDKISRHFKTTYFASTHCYMIAYALYNGYERIVLYGWDFVKEVSKTEDDLWERCGTEYWIGRAEGMGVEVRVILPSSLLLTKDGIPYAFNG